MSPSLRLPVAAATLCLLLLSHVQGHCGFQSYGLSSRGKPLLKRADGHTFKTVLSLDPGALRGLVTTMVLIEVERSIKQYLLNHPDCMPQGMNIISDDDFDINLADYFDCMTGVSAGSWQASYLASRGGQGVAVRVLEDPAIIAKYGWIPAGGAEGLRVFFNEYGSTIYPFDLLSVDSGNSSEADNSPPPGTETPLFSLEGLERSLEAFLGNTTLADADTSLLVPTVDLGTGLVVYFVQNAFKNPSATSSATLAARLGPRQIPAEGERIVPDLRFDEGKDYYLKDIGSASGDVPGLQPAKRMTQAGNETVEFLLVDGGLVKENTDLFAALFVSRETRSFSIEKVALLSIGVDNPLYDLTRLSDAGSTQWSVLSNQRSFSGLGGNRLWISLMDYLYYSDPTTKPFQYLRIDGLPGPAVTELENFVDSNNLPQFESLGRRIAMEHRAQIDVFVRDFIFG